ncbi:MAG TPA: hypothetical protein PLN38_04850 [Chitinophagales bacterium]|nr:hypothetical protein [Chitinophagales bacterium]
MITLTLNEQEVNVLKSLLVQLMANQINTNAQAIVHNAQNCVHFITQLEKPQGNGAKTLEKLPANDEKPKG